jgi:coproporphyrinogen III oxidase-like Fe-S oxidoreductase
MCAMAERSSDGLANKYDRCRHLYAHIPFHRRCAYCDFNTYANMEDRMAAYVNALCNELRAFHACPPPRQSLPARTR